MKNNEEDISTITFEYMNFKSEVFELNKKSARKNGFIIIEIVILIIKIDSNLSSINICYHLNFRISIMHSHFIKKYLQKQKM